MQYTIYRRNYICWHEKDPCADYCHSKSRGKKSEEVCLPSPLSIFYSSVLRPVYPRHNPQASLLLSGCQARRRDDRGMEMEPHQRPRPASPGRRGDACNGSCCAGVGRLSLEESTDCLHCQIGNGRLCRVAASKVIGHGQYCCSVYEAIFSHV